MDIRPNLERQVDRLIEPFKAFIGAQTTASAFLLLALVAALAAANSPLGDHYEALRHYRMGLVLGGQAYSWSLLHLVNDGLIALFFFLIGLEVKRELLAGELREGGRVRLLLGAALGGMLVPASLYLVFNLALPGGRIDGWGIPMATDTALAIGALAALGSRVPHSVVAFLVGLAIIDDIGAILVIALVYTERLALPALAAALALLATLLLFNRAGVRHPSMYILTGIGLWIAIVESGVHASIAGVIVAATVPARPQLRPDELRREVCDVASEVTSDVQPEDVLGEPDTHRRITEVERLAQGATTPLRRWENDLELPVALLVLPLFAFLNAGIPVDLDALLEVGRHPVALGVLFGLVVGKPIGLLTGVWLAERFGAGRRPAELSNRRLVGIGLLAGVGFTMSTFIANLALGEGTEALDIAKLAIVLASGLAGIAGYVSLRWAERPD